MTLRQLRESAALTQEQVAERAGLRQGAISNLESGRVPNPTIDTLEKLAHAYGVHLSDLVTAVRESVAEAAA